MILLKWPSSKLVQGLQVSVMVAQPTTADSPTLAVQVEGPNEESLEGAVVLRSLSYAYAGHRPILSDISLSLPRGSRCLLVGANGAGAHQRCLSRTRLLGVCPAKAACVGHTSCLLAAQPTPLIAALLAAATDAFWAWLGRVPLTWHASSGPGVPTGLRLLAGIGW